MGALNRFALLYCFNNIIMPNGLLLLLLHLLPGGKEWLPAVDSLGERTARMDNPTLISTSTALHNHTGHLYQLNRTLPVLQGLSKI